MHKIFGNICTFANICEFNFLCKPIEKDKSYLNLPFENMRFLYRAVIFRNHTHDISGIEIPDTEYS